MPAKTAIFLGVLLATGAGVAVGSWHEHQQRRVLEAKLAARKVQLTQTQSLENEHARLEAQLEALGPPANLEATYAEAASLRWKIEAARLRNRTIALQMAPNGETVAPVWPANSIVVPASEWKFVGSDRPDATLESVLWTAREGDIDRLAGLIDFRQGDREKAEAFFSSLPPEAQAEYGKTEKLVATLIAGTLPPDYQAMASFGETSTATDESVLHVRIERQSGQQQDATFMFHRGEDGWKLDVPAVVVARFERQIKGPKGQ